MDQKKDIAQRIDGVIGLLDELRLKAHLLGREGRDLLTRLERTLADAEHRLRSPETPQKEIARILHDLHQGLGRLRERAAAREEQP